MYFKMPWSGEKLVKYNIPRTGETDPDEEQETFFSNTHQLQLFALRPPKQLLKWVGNKQKYASQIANFIPEHNTYVEPFLGGGAVLGTLSPASGMAGDIDRSMVFSRPLCQCMVQLY